MDLTSCRGQGYGTEGPISWLSISQYCHENGILGEQREDLFFFVQNMDAVYLEHKGKQLKAQTNKGKKPAK